MRDEVYDPAVVATVMQNCGADAIFFVPAGSVLLDTPAGPSIVTAATILFLLSQLRPAR